MYPDSKKKILFVIDALSFGGGETVFAQIIRRLPPEKYISFLASSPNKEFYQVLDGSHVSLIPLDFSKQVNLPLIFQLKRIIKKNRIDIVHGQGARAEFYARLANKITGRAKYISSIATLVEEFEVSPLRQRLYRLFNLLSAKFVDYFIVVSDFLKKKIINEYKIPPEKVVRIYNGIESDYFRSDSVRIKRSNIKHEFNLEKDCKIIGSIGRLAPKKGFEYLIQAIPGVLKTYPEIKVLIVGDGPLKAELRVLSEKLGVKDNVIFTGFRTDIKDILNAIDIFIMPSLVEGFPMVVLEAMAMGKPIIATRIDGIKEQIIDSETGLLVSPCDADALAKSIIHLFGNRKFRNMLGVNARKLVEKKFSIEKMIANVETTYQDLLESHIQQ